jgi:hypothetical protein
VRIGTDAQPVVGVQELFAPAQFFDMSDDDKLAAPSFESMDAGFSVGAAGYAFDFSSRVTSPFHYTDIVVGADGAPELQDNPHEENPLRVMTLALVGPAGSAASRRTLRNRFAAPVSVLAPTVRAARWAGVSSGGTTAMTTWAEARGHILAAADPRVWTIVPATEMAGS